MLELLVAIGLHCIFNSYYGSQWRPAAHTGLEQLKGSE